MWRKVLIGTVFTVIVGGTLAGSHLGDADVLTRVGRKATDQILAVLPERSRVAGPFARIPITDFVGLEEKIRARFRTDVLLEQSNLTITVTESAVKLAGRLDSAVARDRAVQLAQSTVGVSKVEQEIAVPDGA